MSDQFHGQPKNKIRKSEDDFYPTPRIATDLLLGAEKFGSTIWEPACGDGSMSKPLEEAGNIVLSTDINPRDYGGKLDFLKVDVLPEGVKAIVTNPPYVIATEFILKALSLGAPKVAMLLRYTFMEGLERQALIFKKHPLSYVYMIIPRLKINGQTSAFGHAWFIWDREYKQSDPSLRWLVQPGKTQF